MDFNVNKYHIKKLLNVFCLCVYVLICIAGGRNVKTDDECKEFVQSFLLFGLFLLFLWSPSKAL